MSEDIRRQADQKFEEALERTGARDPREFYREALRELRVENPQGYDQAVRHFREVLVPAVAQGSSQPLEAWREYGRLIAELTAPGRTVALDDTGRSESYGSELPLDRLVLHMPEARGRQAILVSLPPHLSRAQKAAYDLLVAGKRTL
jgi:hypothetical protein